jgi:RNA polymerase sigma-70 factor, ECF subfamily
MMKQDDNVLVQRVRDGDSDAFYHIVKRHQKNIFYIGLKFFHNTEDAEDFAQDVFLKAFEKLDSFSGEVPLKGWLYKLAFHMAVNKYHLRKQQFLLLTDITTVPEEDTMFADTAESVEDHLMKKESRREVEETLKKLPDVYNLVIKMYYYDGLKLKEIAEIMDIPLNTVKSYIFRAKRQIKNMLEGKPDMT